MVEYPNVVHKKQTGKLTLSQNCLLFEAPSLQTTVSWEKVTKHQVSPESYPKSLLKLVLAAENGSSKNASATFQLPDRKCLERIRKEITVLKQRHQQQSAPTSLSGQKRSLAQLQPSTNEPSSTKVSRRSSLDSSTQLAVHRAALLAAHPKLRQQHSHLVKETQLLSEDDFWLTHANELHEEDARLSGLTHAGTSSVLQAHLPLQSTKFTLGVEEMRQIFILYPAVHQAYEEKVPLELSEEQFWRKYLESEYFHRDRGRMGTLTKANKNSAGKNGNKKNEGMSVQEQDARAAAVGTDDMFSRYAQKLQERSGGAGDDTDGADGNSKNQQRQWGRHLAVGQFDLASTLATERGELLVSNEQEQDETLVPDPKGARVIDKYNRHWAMVLHPRDAVAGVNLRDVARQSSQEDPEEDVARAGGGIDAEMRRLVDYCQTDVSEANHAAGLGHDGSAYVDLDLHNVDAYYRGASKKADSTDVATEVAECNKRYAIFCQAMIQKTQAMAKQNAETNGSRLDSTCFPPAQLGRELLSALTKKMARDSQGTDTASVNQMVQHLPEDFRQRLFKYFSRCAELLRHFFGLRKLSKSDSAAAISPKLTRLVRGLEQFYREMEEMRKGCPATETGELMRRMCLPIMEQLDWAFQLYREDSSNGSAGGFVTVE